MPHLNYRSLVIASAALLGSALSASAQFVDLLTEAPVTLQATLQTTVTTTTSIAITTTPSTVKLTNTQVLQELATASIIPDPPTGWSLVAVRSVPADLVDVDAGFKLYATNGSSRVAVPTDKFAAAAHSSVHKYIEKHQGRYVYSSSGTVTNHAAYSYNPAFTVGLLFNYKVTDSESAGFAKVNFVTKDMSDPYEIFFYAISSVSATTKGGYSGTVAEGSGTPAANTGLFSLTVTVGTPKLVPASLYPDVAVLPPSLAGSL